MRRAAPARFGHAEADINSRVPHMRASLAVRPIALVIAASLAACSEDNGPPTPTEPTHVVPAGSHAVLAVTCAAVVSDGTVTCGAPEAGAAFADVIFGGQNQYVILAASNINTSASDCPGAQVPDPAKHCMAFDLTVTNLIPQPLGTTDTAAVTPDPNGVRIFFQSGPTSTGTGTVLVANYDALGSFTGSNQPYYQYNQVLTPSGVSSPKHWEFQFTPDVPRFTFTVYVSTAVPYPDGYINDLPRVITLDPNESFFLSGTVRTFVGAAVPGATITFTSANPGLASVSGNQVTAGVTNGSTQISAQSGPSPGTTRVYVSVCPSIVLFDGASVNASISGSDCFTAFHPADNFLPGTSARGDLYRVALLSGQTVEITMDTGNGLDSYLVLADQVGNIRATNDNDPSGALGVGSRITFTAPSNGTYVIQATTATPGATGGYILGVSIP